MKMIFFMTTELANSIVNHNIYLKLVSFQLLHTVDKYPLFSAVLRINYFVMGWIRGL